MYLSRASRAGGIASLAGMSRITLACNGGLPTALPSKETFDRLLCSYDPSISCLRWFEDVFYRKHGASLHWAFSLCHHPRYLLLFQALRSSDF